MEGEGNLHLESDFKKAKRNLIWFCSFAILLWLVHVPADGALEPPMLGRSAKLDVASLRAIIWIACVYCLIGFYRQVKNVDRLNSEALYTSEFETIRSRLTYLGDTFEALADKAKELLDTAAPVKFLPTLDLQEAPSKLLSGIHQALAKIDELLRQIADRSSGDDISQHVTRQLMAQREVAQKGIEVAVYEAFRSLNESHGANATELAGLANVGERGREVAEAISELQSQFHKLSRQIRGEHRVLYTWYDKYLPYAMFFFATVASGWEIIEIGAAYFAVELKPVSAWILVLVVAAMWFGLMWSARRMRVLLTAQRARRTGGGEETADKSE